MAAIFIVAGLAIAEKIEKKKEAKRQKKADDAARYAKLQVETTQRLARRDSGNIIENTFAENPEEEEEDEVSSSAVDDKPPPSYEDVIEVGERREKEWQAQMQRRRSSAYSNRGNNSTAETYMRMG